MSPITPNPPPPPPARELVDLARRCRSPHLLCPPRVSNTSARVPVDEVYPKSRSHVRPSVEPAHRVNPRACQGPTRPRSRRFRVLVVEQPLWPMNAPPTGIPGGLDKCPQGGAAVRAKSAPFGPPARSASRRPVDDSGSRAPAPRAGLGPGPVSGGGKRRGLQRLRQSRPLGKARWWVGGAPGLLRTRPPDSLRTTSGTISGPGHSGVHFTTGGGELPDQIVYWCETPLLHPLEV